MSTTAGARLQLFYIPPHTACGNEVSGTMLRVDRVSKIFGGDVVLNKVSFQIGSSDRVALIGPNGCGKSTLLQIIAGQIPPDGGRVHWESPRHTCAFVPQTISFPPATTVGDLLIETRAPLADPSGEVERLALALSEARPEQQPALLAAYQVALTALVDNVHGQDLASRPELRAVMEFADLPDHLPAELLSGGQQVRLALARALAEAPDLLMLDEPTNHLDVAALDWLEEVLLNFKGALLVVSHDRRFLDRVATRVLALEGVDHTLQSYTGNYTDYAQEVDRSLARQWSAYHEQQVRVARLEASIHRVEQQARGIEQETIHFYFRKVALGLARRATVQKRRLERSLADEQNIEKPSQSWQMKLDLVEQARAPQIVLALEALELAFPPLCLLTPTDLTLRHGDRVALLGANGTGKSTLLRCIAGEMPPFAGKVRLGPGVKVGYLSQTPGEMTAETPLAAIRQAAPLDETAARTFLHQFLFSGDDVFRPCEKLSAGERARLELARLVAKGCNFLILDEPTNHLDIASRQRFEQALASYDGTLLAAVHDRFFAARCATTTWTITERRLVVDSP
jgi:ATP-binding cassette, subfamily F, member 3